MRRIRLELRLTMQDIVGRMEAFRNENLTLQQQETLRQTATTGPVLNVHMKRLIGVLVDQVRVLSETSKVTLVDVKRVGNPSVLRNDASRVHEWDKQIDDNLIGMGPQFEVMVDWALENETEILKSMRDCRHFWRERRPD